MDHLSTNQERRDRWYSRDQRPRYVHVEPASELAHMRNSSLDSIKSIPYRWISDQKNNVDLKRLLQNDGFVVISGVLTETECVKALELAWEWIHVATIAEQIGDSNEFVKTDEVAINKTELLSSPNFPRSVEGGIFPFYGSGNSSFAWNIRSNPKVKKVFQKFHGCSNLLSSLDGIILWRPGNEYRTDIGWFHVDQNPSEKKNVESIQGLVNLLPVSCQTGGNVLIKESNQLFPKHYLETSFYQARLKELNGADWMEIPHDDAKVFRDAEKIIACQLNPGDILLWDSRTVHCSYPSTDHELECSAPLQSNKYAELDEAASGLLRAATLVSMIPAERVSLEVTEKRKEAVNAGRTLTHWVDQVTPLGAERDEEASRQGYIVGRMKRLQGCRKVLYEFHDLTEEQKALVVGIDNKNKVVT